ncbi:MAG: excinuclease ABC subunit UvrC, partial [Gammaproteobacteria bacterium]
MDESFDSKAFLSSLTHRPGVYRMLASEGTILYVGKARDLRKRVATYFGSKAHHPKTQALMAQTDRVEVTVTGTEQDALLLEHNLIKEHRPRFNVRLVDDKSYPFLAVTVGDEWPRPMVMRGAKRKGVRYYGPFAHAYAIRETLDLLLRTFPLRTCSDNKFNLHQKQGRPCLLFHIEKCSGPCVGEIDREAYQVLTDELLAFLDGETDDIVKRLEQEMREAASELEFERAARLRDQLGSVRKAIERQQMVAERNEDFDVLGLAEDELEAAVQVFFVRRGRVVGRKGFIVDKVEDLQPGELIGD